MQSPRRHAPPPAAAPSPAAVLNPQELHRRCVQLDGKVRLLERRLEQKDAERTELFQEAKLLQAEKARAAEQLQQAREEGVGLRQKLAEIGRVCQKMLQERHDWRGKEQQLRHQLLEQAQAEAQLRGEVDALRQQAARSADAARRHAAQLQEWEAEREQLRQRQLEAEAAAELARRVGATQTDLALDDQQRRIIEADAIASVGLAEARGSKAELQQLRAKVAHLEGSTDTANQACETYRRAIHEQGRELELLSRDLEEVRAQRDQECERAQRLLAEAAEREHELHNALDGISNRNLGIEDTRQELERLGQKELAGLREQLEAARAEAAALSDRARAAEQTQEVQQRRHQQLMELMRQRCSQGEEQSQGASLEIQRLNGENREVMEEYCRVRQQRDDARQQLQRLEDTSMQLRERAIQAEEQSARHLAAAQRQQREVLLLQQELETQRAEQAAAQLQQRLRSTHTAAPSPAPQGAAEGESPRSAPRARVSPARRCGSPPTELQALLRNVTRSPDPPPAPASPAAAEPGEGSPPASPPAADEAPSWAPQLWDLCEGLREVLSTVHRTASYLLEERHKSGAPAERGTEALLSGKVPISPCPGGTDPLWGAALELCSALRYCSGVAQQQTLFLVTEWRMARKGLLPPADQPSPRKAAGQQSPRCGGASPSAGRPPPRAAPDEAHSPPEGGCSPQSEEDYRLCVDVIHASQKLLRSARPSERFPGEAHIAALRRELADLQRAGHAPRAEGRAAAPAPPPPPPAPQPVPPHLIPAEPPQLGGPPSDYNSDPRRTTRWSPSATSPTPVARRRRS